MPRFRLSGSFVLSFLAFLIFPTPGAGAEGAPPAEKATALPNPILFAAQVPIPADFATIGSTFANHRASVRTTGRGGDLFILYPDGTLRNLTREAGFGSAVAFQGADSIAVRDPDVHWDGDRALFSMAIGAPTAQFQQTEHFWQIYEVTGLAQGETAAITRLPHQPPDYNNVSPIYSPDGRVIFTSDRPRNGQRHLYPQHDEYESTPTNTGLFSLDLESGELVILDHSPSGDFTPLVDSFGRVLFTRWDHLQRDQQADADAAGGSNGTFDFADESAGAARLPRQEEVFPEPRAARADLLAGTNMNGLRFNHFFPWQIFPDGTEHETLNHVGRHELHAFFTAALNDDPSLEDFFDVGRFNPNDVENLFQIAEDPTTPGLYYSVDAPEFGTHASGRIVTLTGAPDLPADQMTAEYVTHPITKGTTADGAVVPPEHSGHYRDPLPLTDGALVASHTFETRAAGNEGSGGNVVPRYDFRLRRLDLNAGLGHFEAVSELTAGIVRRVEYWDPDQLVIYEGPLWELGAVEVRSRPQPPILTPALPAPESQIFANAGIDPAELRLDLERRGLALVVSRDVTTRDAADLQQPFNLRIADGAAQTQGDGGQLYEMAYLQFFQADQVRGIGGIASPNPGRRVLARPMHDPAVDNPPAPQGPPGSVALAADGSMAALVPARRAMTWQLTAADHTPVVRERYWLTFQPGEIRVCASCHGLNSVDQAAQGKPTNPPQALATLLEHWRDQTSIFSDGFESGNTTLWSGTAGE